MANSSSLMAVDIKNPTFDHLQTICQNPDHQALHHQDNFQYYQPLMLMSPGLGADQEAMLMRNAAVQEEDNSREEESGRGKLFRHWNDVAGGVCIPEKWGQEALLKDWMDSSLFDAFLAPKEVVSAREALVAERKRETTRQLIKMERMF